jgi:hypothetical protein
MIVHEGEHCAAICRAPNTLRRAMKRRLIVVKRFQAGRVKVGLVW